MISILRELFTRPYGLARDHHLRSSTATESTQLKAAIQSLKDYDVDRIKEKYSPLLTQADLDDCDQRTPWPSVRLIEDELDRIETYLRPIFVEAGFPFEARSLLVRNSVDLAWARGKGTIHQEVFGNLELPEFFDLGRNIHGLLLFEQTRKHKDRHGKTDWIGMQSQWRYGRFKPVFGEG
ncbi:hypothetical protein [uncultured Roseobacter sp.]|uniref:hypothetical protein n=1 Tax=uncultured Roseobacter sp. TaxID=114847 RepID=UPI0026315DBD|nr:hypothetical protein [uncultured Roseobacter sp.]